MVIKSVSFMVASLIVACAVLAEPQDSGLADSTVVAAVSEQPILYSDIDVERTTLVRRFTQEVGRPPQSEGEWQRIHEQQLAREEARLVLNIRCNLRKVLVEQNNLEPKDEEVAARWKSYLNSNGIDLPSEMLRQQQYFREYIDALKEVVEGGRDPQDVYKQKMANYMSEDAWMQRLTDDGTKERLAELARALPLIAGDSSDFTDAIRMTMVDQALDRWVDKQIAAGDREYAAYLVAIRSGARDHRETSKEPMYQEAKRYAWWQAYYNNASLEIKVDQFKGVWRPPFSTDWKDYMP